MNNVLVLGSGRSGTSMVSGILNNNGYYLGDNYDYLAHRPANPKGFFEDNTINEINELIISHSVPKIFKRLNFLFPQFTERGFHWLGRIPLWLPIRSNNIIDQKIEKALVKDNFCYKDPRFSFTLPIWKRKLSSQIKFIVVYRNPNQTVESILREYQESGIEDKVRMNNKMAFQVWKNNYSHILRNFQKSEYKNNWLFLHYNQFFDDVYKSKMSNFLEKPLDFSFADQSLSRTSEQDIIENPSVRKLYFSLNMMSGYKKG